MPSLKPWAAVVFLALAPSGCVSKSTHRKVLDELATTQGDLERCQAERDEQAAKLRATEDELNETRSARDAEAKARQQAEAQLDELQANLETTKDELAELRKQREATLKRLEAFRQLNEKFRSLVDTGKLAVQFRNGQMVLKLPAGVLFPSGKATLSKDGQAALKEIVDVLLQFKDRRFVVAGHTDNRKIRTRQFKDNWDLSTARATTIVRFMVDAGFDPKNLAAAGYGEHDPIASNDTPEGRQLNRRIEIILVPDLSELPNLTQQAQ